MTKSLRIAGQNWADSSSVSASSAISTLLPDRVLAQDLADVWRATASPAWLLSDLGTPRSIGVAALIATNMRAGDTVRLRISTADATGTAGDAYDSGVVAADVDARWPRLAFFIDPNVIGRYVRFDLVQPSAAPEAGRLYIARTWAPSRHFRFGWEALTRDWSIVTMSLGLNRFTDLRRKQEGMRFTLKAITEAEFEGEVRELNWFNGTSTEVMVCRNVDAYPIGSTTFYGEMESTTRATQLMAGHYNAEFEIWNRL